MQGLRTAWREAKNIANGYSDIQAKLREATSIDHSGPSTAQLQELAAATHHSSYMSDLIYIFNKRLNDHGKYWRHVYKTLVVLEFCVIFGSEAIVNYAKESIYTIKTLKEFIHIDDKGRDKGILVREKSKDLVELLSDELLLANCRHTGQFPNYTRPKSAEPITVDPKQRKRIGRGDDFSDLQNMDETDAMRAALSASRSENSGSKYQSLELDVDSSSSDEERCQNPFAVQQIDFETTAGINPFNSIPYEYPAIEMNPFNNSMALPYSTNTLMIENPFIAPQIETSELPQIEYNIVNPEPFKTIVETVEEAPFVPRPDAFSYPVSDNHVAAKPVGPYMAAPQFGYSKSLSKQSDNPFGEEQFGGEISEAQNSPHFNLQK